MLLKFTSVSELALKYYEFLNTQFELLLSYLAKQNQLLNKW